MDFDSLQELLLDLAGERSLDRLLGRITGGLAEQAHVALARIWLIRPGDICPTCPRREECERYVPCLHLVASAGNPFDETADWSRLDGDFRRFPIGVRKVGAVAESGGALCVDDIEHDASFLARPDWAEAEEIRAFGGQPLVYRGEILGVLGVFLRRTLGPSGMRWLRLFADHAAAAIANARAFEEIERLRTQLENENEVLKEEFRGLMEGDIIGESPSLRRTLQQVELVAPTDATVLIHGESGTGKELIARAIHRHSERDSRPLIRVNCASIPRELFESEFFGHVRGSFTGAVRDRRGRFAAADGGTLFLDEVGEIPLELQSKLLRVLQEGQYERVGEERTRGVDVRVIAATNRELEREVEAGRFRQDLYYRLNVFPIEIEPLRHRPEDLEPLARHFLLSGSRRLGVPPPRLTRAHLETLRSYDWPGNVRELRNVVERALIASRRGGFVLDVPSTARGDTAPSPRDGAGSREDRPFLTETEMQARERDNLRAAMEAAGWKVSGRGGAAELLGLKPTTLASRLKKLGIERSP